MACLPNRHGLGVAYTVSHGELEARRRKALESYPDAGVPNWQPNMGQLILCIARHTDAQGELPCPEAGGGYPLFLPIERCVSEPPPRATATLEIKPNFSLAEFWARFKSAWRKLSAI